MDFEKACSVLDISPSNVELSRIQSAYHEKVKETHPDTGGTRDKFITVQQAYELLLNSLENDTNICDESKSYSSAIYPASVKYVDYLKLSSDETAEEVFADTSSYDNSVAGSFTVSSGQTVLEAAEKHELDWPYSCRGGACANCAVYIVSGNVSTPDYTILSDDLYQDSYRLSCIGKPLSKQIKLVYNVKHKDQLAELLLPER